MLSFERLGGIGVALLAIGAFLIASLYTRPALSAGGCSFIEIEEQLCADGSGGSVTSAE